jgi:hypothetical protein
MDREFRRRKSSLVGTLAESLAHRILILKGFRLYQPWLLQRHLEDSSEHHYNLESEEAKFAYERERDYHTLLKDERVRSFMVELKPVQNRNLERRWSGLLKEFVVSETQRAGFPDFIARKGKNIYAIEVKTGNPYLLANQLEVLQLAKKHGLKPYVLHMRMDIAIKEVKRERERERERERMEQYPRKRG